MAHHFKFNATIHGVTIEKFRELVSDISLHERICHKIPGENLVITESKLVGQQYTLRREYNLAVNIPDVAKKILKDAFRLTRSDITQLDQLTSDVELGANLPLKAKAKRYVTGGTNQVNVEIDWEVKVSIPLIGGFLEKHAEGEIRRFSDIEINIINEEIQQILATENAAS